MLHRLEIENFYSIRDPQIIDLRADGHAPADTDRLAPAWNNSVERVPKVVTLFGPNASGKTTVLKALSFVIWCVRDSFNAPPEARLPFDRFNSQDAFASPTRLSIQFGGPVDLEASPGATAPACNYAYEIVIGGGPNARIDCETLEYWPLGARRRARLLTRDADGNVTAGKVFGRTKLFKLIGEVLRPNVSVIAALAQLGHPSAKRLRDAAANVISVFFDAQAANDDIAVRLYAQNPALVEAFNAEVARFDVGIRSMSIEQRPTGPVAMFTHSELAVPMPIAYESHGTRQFLRWLPVIISVLQSGGVAVLDELDSAIHPRLLPEILRWFHDPVRNPRNAQLWMSCQAASLLEELTKEEIFFCEKDRQGRTRVYGLNDIQSVRRTDNYYKKYMSGVYGALPQVG